MQVTFTKASDFQGKETSLWPQSIYMQYTTKTMSKIQLIFLKLS